MDRHLINKVGLAAVILLAPGGFILGATLAARAYRQRIRARRADVPAPSTPDSVDGDSAASS
jgi:hypothetical protein